MSSNVNDYPAYREFAARFGADQASWAKIGIEHRTDAACRTEMARVGRADRSRYARLLAIEVARATASRANWETCAREAEKRLTEAEAAWKAERRWPALQAEIQRRRPSRQPSTSIRATVTPPAPPPTRPAVPAPVPATPASTNPLEHHAAQLEAEGFHFAARDERRRIAKADHHVRRRKVEEEVARTERLFRNLCRNFGEDYASKYMEGA